MSRVSFNRKRIKLKAALGIRGRLVLLALILVAPLMFERVRSLEATRTRTIADTNGEFMRLATRTAEAQREVISSVEAILKTSVHIYSAAARVGDGCSIMRASLHVDMPWIRNVLVLDRTGKVTCATVSSMVGLDLSDRAYFKAARTNGKLVVSDYILSRVSKMPIAVAAYPMTSATSYDGGVIVAGINLGWMSKLMDNLGGRPGVSAILIDSGGTVLAAPSDQASMIGHPIEDRALLSTLARTAAESKTDSGSFHFISAQGRERLISFIGVPGTSAHLIISVDEARAAAGINREIYTAYLQLGFVLLLVLLGALIASERLIIQPINTMTAAAIRFGRGDRSARVARSQIPTEFLPLARAFNAMAAQLGERERELLASNDRLTVMASVDPLSGLANRRGFQSRLDFEWFKALQTGTELSLLMIDVDHFKLFNDTYGHPEGDTCLTRIGEVLDGIARATCGFAARYGGEEFCLMLPNTGTESAVRIGEIVRASVIDLAIPHNASNHCIVTVSVGVACTTPNNTQHSNDLVEAADAALYAAKHRGRNTTVEHGFARAADTTIRLVG
ncbi:MAG TPA: diguanylate cyclase [Nitrobacter sp.]|jgi:diguanylate cyclase (GGDEF)-like protein|nr:diguanylate cyclase [Nitrobacter sp.]